MLLFIYREVLPKIRNETVGDIIAITLGYP